MTTLSNGLAEAILTLLTSDDIELTLHTADPGKLASANLTSAVEPLTVASTAWSSASDDATTGGRRQTNAGVLDFGDAVGVETLTHIGATEIATGRFASAALAVAQPTVTGQPVLIPISKLAIVGAGV